MIISFGENTFSQLGSIKASTREFRPIQVDPLKITDNIVETQCGSHFTIALSKRGELYAWGLLHFHHIQIPTRVYTRHKISQVKCGLKHCVVLTSTQEVMTWGQGTFGT